MKALVFALLFVGFSGPLFSQQADKTAELSAGASMLLYQSVFSFQESAGVEVAYKNRIVEQLDWQVGARLGLSPALPEGFVRLLISPQFKTWRPSVGLELGVTNRTHFEGEKLLRETRQAMEKDISPIYLAGCAAPLVFNIKNNWSLSFLELHVGTHLGYTGRTMRLQLGLVTLGRSL